MAPPEAVQEDEARALLEALWRPRRRTRPRLAEPLRDAADGEIPHGDGAMAVWRLGEGPATLLIHGWEDDNALWGPLIDRLARFGRAVVVVDLPGHGFSSASLKGPVSAGRAIAEAARTFGPVDSAVGHSFGCVVLAAALTAGLDAQRVVLIAPPLPGPPEERLRRHAGDARPETLARARSLLAAEPGLMETVDLLGAAGAMTAQALIIHALDDEQCPVSNAFDLAAVLPGAATLTPDGLGHRLIAQDAETLDIAALFLDGFAQGR